MENKNGDLYDDNWEQKELLKDLAVKIKQKQNMRLNNIEFRDDIPGGFHIVKWYPNTDYYNKLDEFLENDYCLSACGGWVKGHFHSIDISFFRMPELCYTIAILKYNASENSPELKSVGERLLNLNKQERKDFWKVYKKASIFVKKKNKKDEE